MAEKLGVSKSTIQHEVQIAKAIPAAVRETIRETPLANSKTDNTRRKVR